MSTTKTTQGLSESIRHQFAVNMALWSTIGMAIRDGEPIPNIGLIRNLRWGDKPISPVTTKNVARPSRPRKSVSPLFDDD